MTEATTTARRRNQLSMLHLGAKNMGWDEDTRRAWMDKLVGQRSGKDCTDAELDRLCTEMRRLGALDNGRPLGRADAGGRGEGRPSRAQLIALKTAAKKLGFSGIDDPGLTTFVRKVAKVDSPRFLTARQISHVLVGLERWTQHNDKKESQHGL